MAQQQARARTGRPRASVDGRTVPERLLLAATALFANQGFEGTSVQEIVGAAGVTKGAMYHYFSAKDDLLYEIYTRILAMQMERLEKVVAEGSPVETRLHTATADVVVTAIENLPASTVFFRSLYLLGADKQRAIRRERRRYHEMFRSLIEEGQRSGVFRADITADLSADYFFGALHHLPFWYQSTGKLSRQEVARSFADLFLAGLRPVPVGEPA